MAVVRLSMDVGPDRRTRYREQGLWDHRRLADGIEATAVERPESLALADTERSRTAAELAGSVGATAQALAASGLRAGSGVVLVLGNTVEAVVVYQALLRIGAVTLLLDRRCGASDIDHARSALGGTPLLIVPTDQRDRLVEGSTPGVVLLEELAQQRPRGRPLELPEPERSASAVVLFTSGTTSRPKGVVHSLNTLTAGAENMARITGVDREAIVFLVSPLASITGVMQMHLVADQGAALVLEDRFDPRGSLDRINEVGATFLGGAPVIAERLLRAAAECDAPISLRTLALGGTMLPRPLLALATDRFGIDIARVYGSSEAPNFSGSLPSDPPERRLSDDGALLAGSELRVGSVGDPKEGLVRGPSVFLGYLDPEDNEGSFQDGWYRTGDLVDLDSGRVTVVGRLKEVVNRNGLKISLAEVDAALDSMPGAIEVSTFCVPDPTTGERLAVALVAGDGRTITLDDVVGHLLTQGMARRKLPEQLTMWDEPLPRTASGKVIRAQLQMEASSRPSDLAPRLRSDGAS